jgi:DNA-binding transcriptional LysR family regulator
MNYRLDAAFVPAPIESPELEQIKIKEEEIVIVLPGDCDDLEEYLQKRPLRTIVFEAGCVYRPRLESWLVGKGVIEYQKTVVNSIEGIIHFVESGIGFSFLPASMISKFYSGRNIKTFSISKELGQMTTLLIYRKDLPLTPALKVFIKMIEQKAFETFKIKS